MIPFRKVLTVLVVHRLREDVFPLAAVFDTSAESLM